MKYIEMSLLLWAKFEKSVQFWAKYTYIFLRNNTVANRGHCNASSASYLVSCELRVGQLK